MKGARTRLGTFGGLCVTLTLLFLSASWAQAQKEPDKKYGQRMIAEYAVPPAIIAKYASFTPSAPVKGESAIVNAIMADAVEWSGPAMKLSATSNPYRVVLTVTGSAIADGNLSSLWQLGWEIPRSEDGARELRLSPIGTISKLDVKAGERVSLTAPSSPISVSQDREMFPAANLVNARNFSIQGATVQVWSGVPDASWQELVFSGQGLLVGVIFLLLVWWFRR